MEALDGIKLKSKVGLDNPWSNYMENLKTNDPNKYNAILYKEARKKQPHNEITRYVDASGKLVSRQNASAGFVSGSDPVGELIVEGVALGKPLSWAGSKAVDLGLGLVGKYGSGAVKQAARNKLVGRVISRQTPESPLTTFFNNVGWGQKKL